MTQKFMTYQELIIKYPDIGSIPCPASPEQQRVLDEIVSEPLSGFSYMKQQWFDYDPVTDTITWEKVDNE